MAAGNKLTIVLKSYGGTVGRVAILVAAALVDPSGAAVTAIRAALDALSKAKSTRASINKPLAQATTSAAGVYSDDQDKMVLTFKDAASKYHNFKFPAPKVECFFEEDTDIVDTSQADVAALIGWMLANLNAPSGVALTGCVGGSRIRLRSGKRA